jgi:hypothetical protein
VRQKIAAYIANGAQLGWLLIPVQQASKSGARPAIQALPGNALSSSAPSSATPFCRASAWISPRYGRPEAALHMSAGVHRFADGFTVRVVRSSRSKTALRHGAVDALWHRRAQSIAATSHGGIGGRSAVGLGRRGLEGRPHRQSPMADASPVACPPGNLAETFWQRTAELRERSEQQRLEAIEKGWSRCLRCRRPPWRGVFGRRRPIRCSTRLPRCSTAARPSGRPRCGCRCRRSNRVPQSDAGLAPEQGALRR